MTRAPSALAVLGGGEAPPEIEKRLFAKLRMPNGTWKTTYRHRLDDLNEWLLPHLNRGRRLELMDVGVSYGVSTLEWSDQLRRSGVEHALVAGDLATDAYLASWGGRIAVVLDDQASEALLLEAGPVSIPLKSARPSVRAVRPLLSPMLTLATRGRRRKVSLVTPALRGRPGVEVVRDDITVGGRFESRFDVLRAANLVQPGYFDRADLRKVLGNLRERLREGGLLVVCRTTPEGVNRATLFRRGGNQLESAASLNGGSELDASILDC